MPLTEFQRAVLRLLAAQRGPESFVAGGTVINAAPDSPRYSDDVDIFHDAEESVAIAAAADTDLLAKAGFGIEWLVHRTGFQRALVSRDGRSLRLEWVLDSAFRFFPVQADAEFGWRLHLADLATNKVLALAGRWEVRDFVDTLYLDESYASLGLLAWAAAGKRPGVDPLTHSGAGQPLQPPAAGGFSGSIGHRPVRFRGDEDALARVCGCRARIGGVLTPGGSRRAVPGRTRPPRQSVDRERDATTLSCSRWRMASVIRRPHAVARCITIPGGRPNASPLWTGLRNTPSQNNSPCPCLCPLLSSFGTNSSYFFANSSSLPM